MKMIICVDSKGGMLFHSRRISSDRAVCDRIIALSGEKLWMSPYSRTLFSDEANVSVSEGFLEQADDSDWCFVEKEDPALWLHRAEMLVVFCWNRLYPSEMKFPLSCLQVGWKRSYTGEFSGTSHDRITMEVYQRCKGNC